MTVTVSDKPLVGISSCLLGEKVRYDGAGKLDPYLHDVLGGCVEFVPVCPEAESGMGVPREAMRLVNKADAIRLLTQRTKRDMTRQMQSWMEMRLPHLGSKPLCGYIFKAKSPSCGLFRVKVYHRAGGPVKHGAGIFARAVTQKFPLLPVEEEGRLQDNKLRENFIERVFCMQRWHVLNQERKTINRLTDFHARHKYLLMAHSPQSLRALGASIATAKLRPVHQLYEDYFAEFMIVLARLTTVSKNTSVLQHIMGYFRQVLSRLEKTELTEVIENYHNGLVPLMVPITLLNHYVRKYNEPYLQQQYYLNPHPLELKLRNHDRASARQGQ